MMNSIGAGAGDVVWSFAFLARSAPLILLVCALPAVQRVVAVLQPDDPRIHSWPVELLVAALRIGALILVFWLGWSGDAAARRDDLGAGGALGALGRYVVHDPVRLIAGVVLALIVLLALNLVGGPAVQLVVGALDGDARIAGAITFGVRNLLIIPAFYALSYGLSRPAFLAG
jgi:hypothetical protein